jgi:hypothetical protein
MRSLNDFKASLEKFGIVHQNRFDVTITRRNGPSRPEIENNIKYRCESINIPGIQILTADFKLYGGQPVLKIPNGRTNDEVQMTFIAMKDFRDKNYFEEWLDLISDFSNNKVNYYDNVSSDIYISHYLETGDEAGPTESRKITLINAIPNRMEMVQLDWNQADELLKYSVNFSYESLRIDKLANTSKIEFTHLDKIQ